MMALLDALSAHSDPVSLKHLARATGLHPSTAHRILNDLVIGRYVDRADTPGSYRLGMRLLELGNLVKARLSVREAALEPMRELHKRTGQTVNLSVRQGDEIVYVDRSYSERSGMQVVRAIGGRAPLHLTSSGKLFLALDDPRLIRAYATRTGLAGHTRNSLTEVSKLERELSMVRTRGYARDNEELEVGVRCIAAGIRDDSGRLVAGLSVSAPAERMQDDWIADPQLDPAIEAMVGHGLRFDALVFTRHLPHLRLFAQRWPELPIVIDHGAKPSIASRQLDPWRREIELLFFRALDRFFVARIRVAHDAGAGIVPEHARNAL
jgi:DNA-binding IclR family transcriptional regulator